MNFRVLILYCFCFSTFWLVNAQEIPNISGHWNGTAEVKFFSGLTLSYNFEQTGAILEGYLTTKSSNQRDSSKVKISGTVSSDRIQFKGIEFIYKVGLGCLSNTSLTYTRIGNQELLRGRWYGDMSLKTCAVGTSGKVELIRVKPTIDKLVSRQEEPNSTLAVANTDHYGKAMVSELSQRKYYSLIIGINEYEDESIQDLDRPVLDAQKVQKVLQERYTFEAENTHILSNPSRDAIIEAFEKLNREITDEDQLLIFYAGHGFWDQQMKQGYWLPADAREDSKTRWLSNSTIRDYIGGIKAKHTLLITDACFSGGIFKERGVSFNNSKAVLQLYKLPSRKAMTSGTLTTVPDQSVFIDYLIKNLYQNEKPLLSTGDLFSAFKIAVINNSPNGQVPQYGTISQVGDEGGEFIFLKKQ